MSENNNELRSLKNMDMTKTHIMDTVLRDSHQSIIATRLKTADMLEVTDILDRIGYWSLEVWGGATFDACLRFLREDPWERLKDSPKSAAEHKAPDASSRTEPRRLQALRRRRCKKIRRAERQKRHRRFQDLRRLKRHKEYGSRHKERERRPRPLSRPASATRQARCIRTRVLWRWPKNSRPWAPTRYA